MMIIRFYDSALAVPVEERDQKQKNNRIRGWKCAKSNKEKEDISYITRPLFFLDVLNLMSSTNDTACVMIRARFGESRTTARMRLTWKV
jgi:hypothetical protein